jgi:hypothetical protein
MKAQMSKSIKKFYKSVMRKHLRRKMGKILDRRFTNKEI